MESISSLLQISKEQKASDLHITVGIPPMIRIHGALKPVGDYRLLPQDTDTLLRAIMTEQQQQKYEEKGETDFSFSIPALGRYRVNVFCQRGSMAAAIRIVGTEIPSQRQLKLPEAVMNLHQKRRGLILVTGPTGSGKSTTLASIINEININRDAHVVTLEDPIEYLHQHNKSIVNQREIGLDTKSYKDALRAALRQDPDVILVGEMRDLETISTAITAAETGHLVLSTLHTVGAANTVDRVIDVFPAHQQQQIRIQLAMVLEAVISQQLIPTIEQNGRVAAFEVLLANPAIRNLIREGKTHQLNSVIQTNKQIGMQTMDDALYHLYMNGYISRESILNFGQDYHGIERRLREL